MNTTKKILLTHIIIQTAYILISNVLGRSSGRGSEYGLGVAMLLMFFLAVHCGIALVASLIYFIREKKEPAKAHLLSAVLILLVGVPACFASVAL